MKIQWTSHLTDKNNLEELFNRFKERALELTVKVKRVSSQESLLHSILEEMKERGVKKVAASPLTLMDEDLLKKKSRELGVHINLELDRNAIEQSDMGISEFHMGIAESGTLFQDSSELHCRLVSMLPPLHLAIIRTQVLVPDFLTALQIIQKAYGDLMPPYLTFVTGPSKTADIERVLTIGVHGPGHMIIIFCDQETPL